MTNIGIMYKMGLVLSRMRSKHPSGLKKLLLQEMQMECFFLERLMKTERCRKRFTVARRWFEKLLIMVMVCQLHILGRFMKTGQVYLKIII